MREKNKYSPDYFFSLLKKENFDNRLNSLYGLNKEKAFSLDPKIAGIGFDGDENRLGWSLSNVKWILSDRNLIDDILADADSIKKGFKYVIFCGMGGSGLSVQLVKDTFSRQADIKLYSLRTTSPEALKDILDEISALAGSVEEGIERTLVILISKSGATVETISHKAYFERLYHKYSKDVKKHFWVITDRGSPLDTGDYKQREIQLNARADIGGRFTSPTTNIFLLPLAIFIGEKISSVLRRARQMNEPLKARGEIFLELGAFLYYWAACENKDKLTLFVPASLKSIPMWAEQLVEESLGKDGKCGISIFYAERLSAREISPVEQNDRVFLRITAGGKKEDSGLWEYLRKNNYPAFEIGIEDIYSLGGLMLGLERTVAAIAYLWDICFVDQPAVEGYKKAVREIMCMGQEVDVPAQWRYASFKSLRLYYSGLFEARALSEDEIKDEAGRLSVGLDNAAGVYAAIINILAAKNSFEAVEIISYGVIKDRLRAYLEDIRYNLFTKGLKIPSKLGEGPDKNHSYHQNIEGGKDMWFSTYFLAENFIQPAPFPFDSNLIKAQAIGTVKSLIEKKRKVVLFTFPDSSESVFEDVKSLFIQVLGLLNKR